MPGVLVLLLMVRAEIEKKTCRDRILTGILTMNSGRISARLKARNNNRPIVLRGLQEILTKIVGLRSDARDIFELKNSVDKSLLNSVKPHGYVKIKREHSKPENSRACMSRVLDSTGQREHSRHASSTWCGC